jgi:uncharacterized membrane protein YbhN (UPF0104 family)
MAAVDTPPVLPAWRSRLIRGPIPALARVALSAVGIALLLRNVDLGAAVGTLARASPVLLALALIAAVGWQAAAFAQWYMLLPRVTDRRRVPVRLFLMSSLATLVVPGGVGGDAVRVREMSGVVGLGPCVAAAFGARLVTLVCASAWTLLGSLLLVGFLGDEGPLLAASVLLGAAVCGFLFLHIERLRTRRRPRRRLSRFREEFLATLASYRHPSLLLRVLGIGSVSWGLNIASVALFSASIGAHIAWPLLTLALAASAAITTLPISVNGIGLREGALIAILLKGGVPVTAATALAVFVDVQLVPLGVIGGASALFRARTPRGAVATRGAPARPSSTVSVASAHTA